MDEYRPNKIFPPGETLEELLSDHGMTRGELAWRMDENLSFVNRLISGHIALSPSVAAHLESIFINPKACFWISLEESYREHKAEGEA